MEWRCLVEGSPEASLGSPNALPHGGGCRSAPLELHELLELLLARLDLLHSHTQLPLQRHNRRLELALRGRGGCRLRSSAVSAPLLRLERRLDASDGGMAGAPHLGNDGLREEATAESHTAQSMADA